ncbi:MAG TPA: hypothetical protein VGI74_25060 [Streptosporangiaceae bacterium]|jgi:hypothetical protein
MNHIQSVASAARSLASRRGLRAAMIAGAVAATIGTAGAASASTAAHHVSPRGFAATEECLNWSGTIEYFPALTNTSHAVTGVLSGTLSNCSFDGTPQTFSGSVFGTVTGTATKTKAALSGQVAITWPADSGLNPTISPISVSTSAPSSYSLSGTISAGAGTGEQLEGSFAKISNTAITGGTSQKILGSAPFGIFINEG